MFFKGKIIAPVFARVAYAVLKLVGWKRKTVLANAKHVAGAVPSDEVSGADSKISPDYNTLLKNLTRHASELLFRFGTFKKLPHDFLLHTRVVWMAGILLLTRLPFRCLKKCAKVESS